MNVYEEISGVICSYNVSCDFYIDWLQSISDRAPEKGAAGAPGAPGAAWSTWGHWSNWSGWRSTGAGSTWSTWSTWSHWSTWSGWSSWSNWSSRNTCASTSKIVDAGSDRGVAPFNRKCSLPVIQGWTSAWYSVVCSSIILLSLVMTDDTPYATAFHAATPKGRRRMKGETHEKF